MKTRTRHFFLWGALAHGAVVASAGALFFGAPNRGMLSAVARGDWAPVLFFLAHSLLCISMALRISRRWRLQPRNAQVVLAMGVGAHLILAGHGAVGPASLFTSLFVIAQVLMVGMYVADYYAGIPDDDQASGSEESGPPSLVAKMSHWIDAYRIVPGGILVWWYLHRSLFSAPDLSMHTRHMRFAQLLVAILYWQLVSDSIANIDNRSRLAQRGGRASEKIES